MTTFAARIKSLRSKRNLTQAQMAEKMGISASMLSRYETEKKIPDFDTICMYAERLNVTAEWLSGQHVPRKRRASGSVVPPENSPNDPGENSEEMTHAGHIEDAKQPSNPESDQPHGEIADQELESTSNSKLNLELETDSKPAPEHTTNNEVQSESVLSSAEMTTEQTKALSDEEAEISNSRTPPRLTRRQVCILAVICLLVTIQTAAMIYIFGDRTPPVIVVAPQSIEYGEILSIDDLASATDNRPGSFSLSVTDFSPATGVSLLEDGSLSFDSPGEFSVVISAADRRGNTSSETVSVSVADSIAPELSLSISADPLEYGAIVSLTKESIAASISDVSDVVCEISSIHMKSKSSSTEAYVLSEDGQSATLCLPGEYQISVDATDSYGNTATETVAVSVLDNTAPEIVVESTPVEVKYGTKLELPKDVESGDNWLTVSDVSDVSVTIVDVSPAIATLAYYVYGNKQSVEFRDLGEFDVKISATDSYGNSSDSTVRVSSVDKTKPVFSDIPNEFTLTEYDADLDFLSGVTASDDFDGDVTDSIIVDALNVSYGIPGSYSVSYRVYDSSGNCAEEKVPLEIRDTIPPAIQLSSESLSVDTGSKALDFSGYLSYAYDYVDGDLTSSVKIDDSTVNYNVPGSYDVTYTVSDSAGNASRHVMVVYVAAPKPAYTPSYDSVDTGGGTVYITKTGSKYHRSGCSYLSKSKIAISLSEAKAQGYTACSRCY